MSDRPDVRVLVAGDAEADLERILSALRVRPEVARGVSAAVAAMRLSDFGVLVADVEQPHDALALLRAAGRGRPAARSVVLMPADRDARGDGWVFAGRSAFALLRHPVDLDEVRRLVDEAARDYRAALGRPALVPRGVLSGTERPRDPHELHDVHDVHDVEDARWSQAERRLAVALRRAFAGRFPPEGAPDDLLEDAVAQGARIVAEATRRGDGSPDLLLTIAEALLSDRPGVAEGRQGRVA